jgi:excisionase family DNA binding protein
MTWDIGDVVAEAIAYAVSSRFGLAFRCAPSTTSMAGGSRRVMTPIHSVDVQRADQLLAVADIAGRIGAREQTVRGWIKSGELKAARFGTRIGYRIRLADYDDFLRRRTLTGVIAAHLLKAASTAPDA